MAKKWIAELLAFCLAASSITPLYANEHTLFQPSQFIVAEVDAAYKKGEYDKFLTELHKQYQYAGKAGVLRGLFESAKKTYHSNSERLDLQHQTLHSQVQQLNKERNQRLLQLMEKEGTEALAKKIDAIIFYSLPSEQSEALHELEELKFHIPETTEGTTENKISALETEYYIKTLLLEVAPPSENLLKKKIALSFEKFDKMEDVAKEKNDVIWMEKIALAKEANRLDKGHRIDLDILNGYALEKFEPKNSVEEKLKQIMMEYQQQKRAMIAQHKQQIAQR